MQEPPHGTKIWWLTAGLIGVAGLAIGGIAATAQVLSIGDNSIAIKWLRDNNYIGSTCPAPLQRTPTDGPPTMAISATQPCPECAPQTVCPKCEVCPAQVQCVACDVCPKQVECPKPDVVAAPRPRIAGIPTPEVQISDVPPSTVSPKDIIAEVMAQPLAQQEGYARKRWKGQRFSWSGKLSAVDGSFGSEYHILVWHPFAGDHLEAVQLSAMVKKTNELAKAKEGDHVMLTGEIESADSRTVDLKRAKATIRNQ